MSIRKLEAVRGERDTAGINPAARRPARQTVGDRGTLRSMTLADDQARRRDLYALLFALTFPTLMTVVYFILLAGEVTAIQQVAFSIGKGIQFLFPALWIIRIERRSIGWQRPRVTDFAWGAVLGAALLAGTLALYHFGLKPAGVFTDAVVQAIRKKVEGMAVATIPRYVGLGVFYSVFHSLLEEYYWRWFVFGQLRRLISLPAAIFISGIGFMAHHVCVVSVFFGWFSIWSIGLSLAVAVGGMIWAWLYQRTESLFGPWISHAFVDAALFIVGYDLILRP